MYIKIYFEDRLLYLCDELPLNLKELSGEPGVIFSDDVSPAAVNELIQELKNPSLHTGILFSDQFESLKTTFFASFDTIEAAGGVVENERDELLFIFRRNRWDLPKGKMEAGESLETCAEREIEEETAVKGITLKQKITQTFHVYEESGKSILKISHWFYFICSNNQQTKPQVDEDITEISWFNKHELNVPLTNTYSTIKDVLECFQKTG